MKIGFIGVGAMGRPMAENLLQAGYEVAVFDLSRENVQKMTAKGAIGCADHTEVAALADVVITSLPNAQIVESVMCGEKGVLAACRPETVVIDMSSVAPGSTKKMAAYAGERGVHYIDAPVSGGTKGAKAGTLTIMVGAPDAVFLKVKPVLEVIGKKIYHVGDVGMGDAMKVVNNLLLGCNMAALAEALVLGVKCGLKPEVMRDILSVSSGNSYALQAKMDSFILERHFEGGFAMNLQYKDLNLALETGRENQVPLPQTALAANLYEMGRAAGYGGEDMSGIIRLYEQMLGVEVSK